MFWILFIAFIVLLVIAYGLGISFWGLLGILLLIAVIFCIGCWFVDDGKEERAKLENEEEIAKFDKKIKKKKFVGKCILIGVGVALVLVVCGGLLGSCDLFSSSSSSNYDSDGRNGYGEQYDKDVDYAADAFGEDPDHVNDVYEALANEMR
jgi:flagellar basal body-associated protein FliL